MSNGLRPDYVLFFFQAFRGEFVCLGEKQGQREAENHKEYEDSQRPVRQQERRKDDPGNLDQQPAHDGIGHRDLNDVASS